VGIYTPPPPPGATGNPIADVERAFDWFSQFFSVRAPLILIIGDVVRAGVLNIV
jgi:hypothetical protein